MQHFSNYCFSAVTKKLILNIGFMENSKKSTSILFAKEEQSRVDHHTFFWNFTKCLLIFILTWYHQSPWKIPFLDLAVTCTKFRATSQSICQVFSFSCPLVWNFLYHLNISESSLSSQNNKNISNEYETLYACF